MQRFVYTLAKNHHTDDPEDHNPHGFDKGRRFNKATSKFQ